MGVAAAYEAARIQAVKVADATNSSPRQTFHVKLDNVRVGCNVKLQMLLAYAATDGIAVDASTTAEDDTPELVEGGSSFSRSRFCLV